MMTIKIQCGCGQRYAFDVEPAGGRMPSAVACPVCGADGTAAANAAIAQSMPAQPVAATVPPGPGGLQLRAAAPASAPAPATALRPASAAAPAPAASSYRGGRLPGQVDRTQAENEARAKVLWGDERNSVISYLRIQGFNAQEASELVDALFRERASGIRKNGISKIVIGTLLMCVPVAAFFVFIFIIGVLQLQLFAVTIMVGLYGAYMVCKGIIMTVAPRSEPGDVASH